MNKPAFDPSKPFQTAAAKPAFDPSKPFTTQQAAAPASPDTEFHPEAGADPITPEQAKAADSRTAAIWRGGGTQGLLGGLGDEWGGAVQGGLQVLANKFPDAAAKVGIDARYPQDPSEVYKAARDAERRTNTDVRAKSPKLYDASEMVGNTIMSKVLPGGAAAQGALTAFGNSETKSLPVLALQTAGGAALGKGVELGMGALARKISGGKLAQYFADRAATAQADDLAKAVAQKADKVKSAVSSMGTPAASTARGVEFLQEHLDRLPDDVREAAEKVLGADETKARLIETAKHYIEAVPRGLEDFAARQADVAAAKAIDPAAVSASRLANPVKEQLLPYLKHMTNKAASTAAAALGGPVAGTAAALAMGHPGTKTFNLLNHPSIRNLEGKAGSAVLNGAGKLIEKAIPAAVFEATDNPDEKYRALAEWLRGQGNGQ
jgi:hypothetical protein